MGPFKPFEIVAIDVHGSNSIALDASKVEHLARVGANYLARQRLGGRGRFVASAVASGWEVPVTYLSVWCSGAAVAAVDADEETRERLAWSLRALRASAVVVGDDAQRDAVGRACSGAIVLKTEDMFDGSDQGNSVARLEDLSLGSREESELSHCFFTSGSTGWPKGCVCTRFALATYALARNEADSIDSTSRIVCCSAHTFDPSIGDAAQASASGATLCVSTARINATPLSTFLRAARPSHVTSTPALWASLEGDPPDSLRLVSLGGERMPDDLVMLCAAARYELRCVYGVTECCVYQTTALAQPGVSTGKPLRGTKLRIVDFARRPLGEVGAVGEIAIGGDQVFGAKYLGSEDMARFATIDSERYYLTGDNGRLGTDGVLEIFGRLDDQVKIDGVRIELGEVESLFARHTKRLVRSCRAVKLEQHSGVGIVAESALGSDRLVERALAAAALSLPRRLRPRRLAILPASVEAWPKTRNGKTDRVALLSFFGNPRRNEDAVVPLKTPTENAVSRCWRELLLSPEERDAVPASATDDFVAMGGDSLTALRAARRLEAWAAGLNNAVRGAGGAYGDADVPIRFAPEKMFELRTVRAYASFVGRADFSADDRFVVTMRHDDELTSDDDVVEAVVGDAAAKDRQDIVAALLDSWTPPRRRRHRAVSPLARAAQVGSDTCLSLLLDHYKPTVTDVQRRTPLAVAAECGNGRWTNPGRFVECCALLLAAGAPIAARDDKKQSVLHHCARTGDVETMRLLCAVDGAGALANSRDRWGRSPLAWVALRLAKRGPPPLDIAGALLDAGADPMLTPLPDRAQFRHTSLVAESPLDICLRLRPPHGGELAALFRLTRGGATMATPLIEAPPTARDHFSRQNLTEDDCRISSQTSASQTEECCFRSSWRSCFN